MRKLLVSLVAVGALLGVGGIVASPADALSASTKKALFLDVIREEGIPTAGTVKFAKAFCRAADASSVETAFTAFVLEAGKADLDVREVGYIIGAGTMAFCSDHSGALKALA